MMDAVFLISWLGLFTGLSALVWKYWVNRGRLYVLILLNLFWLASLFYFFPKVLKLTGQSL